MNMDLNVKQQNIQEYFGIVVIIDALGVSNYSIDECRKFINDLEKIISDKERFLAGFVSESEKSDWKGAQIISNTMKNVKTLQFQDTIILAFPIENNYNSENLTITYFIASQLCSLIFNGLIHKIPYRGAISVGNFLWEDFNKCILGPAIADANKWYDATDWLGIIFSPEAHFWLSSLIEKNKNNQEAALLMTCFNNFICEYKVPFKPPLKESLNSYNNSGNFFVVAWPSNFYFCHIKNENSEKLSDRWLFDKLLSDIPKPKGTELKYKNSENFFNWYGTEILKNKNFT
jgi:hypothetical protein